MSSEGLLGQSRLLPEYSKPISEKLLRLTGNTCHTSTFLVLTRMNHSYILSASVPPVVNPPYLDLPLKGGTLRIPRMEEQDYIILMRTLEVWRPILTGSPDSRENDSTSEPSKLQEKASPSVPIPTGTPTASVVRYRSFSGDKDCLNRLRIFVANHGIKVDDSKLIRTIIHCAKADEQLIQMYLELQKHDKKATSPDGE